MSCLHRFSLTQFFNDIIFGSQSLCIGIVYSNQGFWCAKTGMASALAPAVVGNALSDLKGTTSGANILSPKFSRGPHISTPVWVPGSWAGSQSSNHRKRKEAGGMPAGEHPGNGMAEAASSCDGSASAAVQIAALQALEALLTSVSNGIKSSSFDHTGGIYLDLENGVSMVIVASALPMVLNFGGSALGS